MPVLLSSPRIPKVDSRSIKQLARRRWVQVLCTIAAAMLVVWWSWIPKPGRGNAAAHSVKASGRLPLSFEINRGQAPADTKFLARGGGYSLLLSGSGEPTLWLNGRARGQGRRSGLQDSSQWIRPANSEAIALSLSFSGANAKPAITGEQPLAGRSNYLIGNDPSKWITGVPHYASVRYTEVYSGIDVLYYAKDQTLEYDFIVKPGSDPQRIRFRVQGAENVELSKLGNLVLRTSKGRVLLHKPSAFQEGPAGREVIECSYLLHPNGEIGFELAAYDSSATLWIDPVVSYAAQFDGFARAIAVDGMGNSYVAGFTFSGTFPATAGTVQTNAAGSSDAFVAKLDSTGSMLLFATYLGGSDFDNVTGMALDSGGNILVAGLTGSANFPVKNAFQSAYGGNTDGFLTKLDPAATQILYSTYLGGASFDTIYAVAIGPMDRAFVAGEAQSGGFPTTPGAFDTSLAGAADGFVASLDPSQTGTASLIYSTFLGGTGYESASAIAVDSSGNAYATGLTQSVNFPTANPIQMAFGGNEDAFVAKLNSMGTALTYSTFLGGAMTDRGRGIALDSSNNAFVTGVTFSANFPVTMGALQQTSHGGGDAFITKVNAAGSAYLYSSYLGGADWDQAEGVAVDASGNAYLIGGTFSSDFPVSSAVQSAQSGGTGCYYYYFYSCPDVVVPQLNAAGSALVYSTYLGGNNSYDWGFAIAVDAGGVAYIAGEAGATFPFTGGGVQMTGGGGFAAKISPQAFPGFSFGIGALNFPPTPNGSSSMLTVTIQNLGTAPLNVTSISTTANFTASQNCVIGITGGSSCPITVTFSPTAIAPFAGTLTVIDNAAGSPHILMLSGTGSPAFTTTTVMSSLNPSMLGQAVTFTATVSAATATGTVNFLDSGSIIGIGTLNNGMATFATSALSVGAHPITAAYAGDANFAASTSPVLNQTVNKVASTTALTSSLNPSNAGQSVTFTATVSPSTATGSVTFMDGSTSLGTGTLNNGVATFSSSSLTVGNHSITANYGGDANVASSTSSVVTQAVNGIAMSSGVTSATINAGGTANFTLTVTQNGLTAPITFACSGLLSGGTCTFNPNSVLAGSGTTVVNVAIAVGNSVTAVPFAPPPPQDPGRPHLPEYAGLLLVVAICGVRATRGNKRHHLAPVAASLMFILLLAGIAGCGGGGSTSVPTPVTLTVTVNATSGSNSASLPFTITVRR